MSIVLVGLSWKQGRENFESGYEKPMQSSQNSIEVAVGKKILKLQI